MRFFHASFLLLVLTALMLVPEPGQAHPVQREQQIEVALRMIGHQVLLHAGDSTSRVLPIEKQAGQYRVSFETEFAFNPEALVSIADSVFQVSELTDSYIMHVESCKTQSTVYSYQMGNEENPNLIPCRMRDLPQACYSLVFTLLEPDPPVALKESPSWTRHIKYPLIAILMVLSMGTFIVLRKKRLQPKTESHLIALGDFRFDKRNTELVMNDKRIDLTGKEADLLSLLYDQVNTPISREVIMEKVWGDEGSYVGRTLDVFISKLRKKLDADPKVKIVNIRGVGYKLVING